jgi:outer membrane lipoprotein-sorting protein
MKANKSLLITAIAMFMAVSASAQTADEIISTYVQAIGGKDVLNKITSVYTESTMEVMGMQIIGKTTILNGKGMKQEMEVMGSTMTTCLTDKGGWTINPMAGGTEPVDMPAEQFNSAKDQLIVGAPFINYMQNGSKSELLGTEAVGAVNAYKIKLTDSNNKSSVYFFDPKTFFLLKSIQQSDNQGQMVENIIIFSDYKATNGYTMPYKMEMDMNAGQMAMTMTVTKVELNKQVDEAIFSKPK